MATHSSILAWRIPWTEEPGRLQSMGSQRVGHDWATSLHFTSNFFRRLWFTSDQSNSLRSQWLKGHISYSTIVPSLGYNWHGPNIDQMEAGLQKRPQPCFNMPLSHIITGIWLLMRMTSPQNITKTRTLVSGSASIEPEQKIKFTEFKSCVKYNRLDRKFQS